MRARISDAAAKRSMPRFCLPDAPIDASNLDKYNNVIYYAFEENSSKYTRRMTMPLIHVDRRNTACHDKIMRALHAIDTYRAHRMPGREIGDRLKGRRPESIVRVDNDVRSSIGADQRRCHVCATHQCSITTRALAPPVLSPHATNIQD